MKCNIEKITFKEKGVKDYEKYLAEEEEYLKIYRRAFSEYFLSNFTHDSMHDALYCTKFLLLIPW